MHSTHAKRRFISNTKILTGNRRLRRRIQRSLFNTRTINRAMTAFRRATRALQEQVGRVITQDQSSSVGYLRGQRAKDRRKERVVTGTNRNRINIRLTRRQYLRYRQVPPNTSSIFIAITLPRRNRHRSNRGRRQGRMKRRFTRIRRSLNRR